MEAVGSTNAAWPEAQTDAPTGAPVPSGPSPSPSSQPLKMLPMLPWRIVGAVNLAAMFALMAGQIHRLVDDRPWSGSMMWWSIVTGVITGACVLGWTWTIGENVRRLIEPAATREPPNPMRAALAWLPPLAMIAVAGAVVAGLGEQAATSSVDSVSSLPLLGAVAALLLAIPLTYRPLFLLAGLVREVGGQSARLAQWMWVPVALALVGVGSIVALLVSGSGDIQAGSVSVGGDAVPVWLIGVIAMAPCAIAILLAWSGSGTVEEAVELAVARRRGVARATTRQRRARKHPAAGVTRDRVRLIPGDELIRLAIGTLLAGVAMLSVVGAAVAFSFWLESDGGDLFVSQRDRARDALDALYAVAGALGVALLALVTLWTFVAVANARMASGVRRNPFLAAAAWPLAAFGIWAVADRFVVDQSAGSVLVGAALQVALLWLPFRLLERTAEAVEARRSPVTTAFVAGAAIMLYAQVQGGLTGLGDEADVGRFAALLALGAVMQLLATLAVTEACRTIGQATHRMAEEHNAMVERRELIANRPAGPEPTSVPDPLDAVPVAPSPAPDPRASVASS